MKPLTRKEFSNFMNQGCICFHDECRISEFDEKNDVILSDFQEDIKFDTIDFDFIRIYEQETSESFTCDVEEIIKTIKKCIKEQDKFLQGKSCICLIEKGCSDIYTIENMEEMLSDIDFLYGKIHDLEICKLKSVKG